MNEPLILTMDFGTQSVRVALFDKRGYMVAMKKKDYDQPYFSLQPNWAEKEPYEYYQDLCLCTKELARENPSSMKNIKGITLTCFRDTAVLLDQHMKVIRPSVLWLDQRNAKCEKPLPKLAQFLFKLVGKSRPDLFSFPEHTHNSVCPYSNNKYYLTRCITCSICFI